jgi:hypothetical protein
MPIDMTCPKCGLALRIPEKYGGSTRTCHGCGAAFQVPASGAATGPTAVPVPPQPQSLFRSSPDDTRGPLPLQEAPPLKPVAFPEPAPAEEIPVLLGPEWRSVDQGLGFVHAGLLAFLLSAVATLVGSVLHLDVPGKGKGGEPDLGVTGSWALWLIAGNLPTLVGFLLFLHGRLLCARAPASSRCRGFALGSVLATFVALLGLAVFLFAKVFGTVAGGTVEALVMVLLGLGGLGLAGLIGEILFLCFLSRLAGVLQSGPLRQSLGRFNSLAIGMIGMSVIVGCLLAVANIEAARQEKRIAGQHPQDSGMVGLLSALGIFVVSFALILGYRALITTARRAVHESLVLGGGSAAAAER